MKTIDKKDWVRFGGGGEGSSWYHKTDESVMLKLFDGMQYVDAEATANLSNAVLALGVLTPKALDVVQDETGCPGIIYERMPEKESLLRMVKKDGARIKESATRFAEEVKKLHSTPCNTEVFPHFFDFHKKVFGYLILQGKYSEEEKQILMGLLEKFWKAMDQLPKQNTCLMGDCHPGNVVLSKGKAYFIDLGTFAYGHPYYDIASLYYAAFSEITFSDAMTAVVPKEKFFEREQIAEYWDVFARVYIGSDKEEDVAAFCKELKPFSMPRALILNLMFAPDFGSIKALLEEAIGK